jgi:hypothetical protein
MAASRGHGLLSGAAAREHAVEAHRRRGVQSDAGQELGERVTALGQDHSAAIAIDEDLIARGAVGRQSGVETADAVGAALTVGVIEPRLPPREKTRRQVGGVDRAVTHEIRSGRFALSITAAPPRNRDRHCECSDGEAGAEASATESHGMDLVPTGSLEASRGCTNRGAVMRVKPVWSR